MKLRLAPSHEAILTKMPEEYAQPLNQDTTLLSNEDVADLESLISVERIGDPPDGCDPRRYLRLGLIEKTDRFWTLTADGRERLAELRAEANRYWASLPA